MVGGVSEIKVISEIVGAPGEYMLLIQFTYFGTKAKLKNKCWTETV